MKSPVFRLVSLLVCLFSKFTESSIHLVSVVLLDEKNGTWYFFFYGLKRRFTMSFNVKDIQETLLMETTKVSVEISNERI